MVKTMEILKFENDKLYLKEQHKIQYDIVQILEKNFKGKKTSFFILNSLWVLDKYIDLYKKRDSRYVHNSYYPFQAKIKENCIEFEWNPEWTPRCLLYIDKIKMLATFNQSFISHVEYLLNTENDRETKLTHFWNNHFIKSYRKMEEICMNKN